MIEPLAILVIIGFAVGFKAAVIMAVIGVGVLGIAAIAKTAKEGR